MFGVICYHPPPPLPDDADLESKSDCVLGPEAYVSLNKSVPYSEASSGLKIWSISVIRYGEYSTSLQTSVVVKREESTGTREHLAQ